MDIISSTESSKIRGTSALTLQSIRTGLWVCMSLIIYFLIMESLGFLEHLILRAFNLVLLVTGIYWALYRYSRSRGGKIDYFDGIRLGIQTTLIATAPFAVFIGIFLGMDAPLMNYIIQTVDIGNYVFSPLTASAAVAAEGISSGFIVTFILMPWFKKQ